MSAAKITGQEGGGARRWRLRAAALALGALLAVGLAEAALRLLSVGPRLTTKRSLRNRAEPLVMYHCYDSDPTGELGPAPDVREGFWELFQLTLPPRPLPLARLPETPRCVRYRRAPTVHGPAGPRLRGAPPAERPRDGVVRILGLGDSFAYGEGVPEERTLFAQLGALLGPGHEILNAARPGNDTRAELQTLRDLAGPYHCGRALVVFVPNDIALSPALAARQNRIYDLINIRDQLLEDHQAGAWYQGHLRLAHLLGERLALWRMERDTIAWYLDSYDPRHNAEQLAALAADLRAMGSLPGVRVALVLYPLMEGLGRYPLAPVHERVAALAREAGLPVLDLAPAFRGQRASSLWVHPTDHHPNGRAHGIAARAIADWLRGVPGFLAAP